MTNKSHRILNFLASAGPLASDTVDGDTLHEILLETGGTIIGQGTLYNLKSKVLGAGVYQISLEAANP